jgi:hypothetical protein
MPNVKIAIGIIVAFVIGLGVGLLIGPQLFFAMHPAPLSGPGGSLGPGSNIATTTTGSGGTPFSSFQFESSSYLISGNATLSPAGKAATSDFNLTSTPLANGSTEYSLKFKELSTVYNVTVGAGSKLYFIDVNLPDDSASSDTSLGDDGYAVVNATGYVISYKYPLPRT